MTTTASPPKPRRGGRPSRQEAGRIEEKILDAATSLFFSAGYGAVSIEQIARRAHISKRTFYARFDDKAALFRAVVNRVIAHVRPPEDATNALFKDADLEKTLRRIAPVILRAALAPDTLALHRVMLAEAARFPELALIVHQQGARQEAVDRISALLAQSVKKKKRGITASVFAAEQFLMMLTSTPQRRALGLGTAMQEAELKAWAQDTVDLFLNGVLGA